jgi:integrase
MLLQEQLAKRQERDTLVFVGRRRKLINKASLVQALRRNGYTCTPHGFRSSVRVWCAERTSYPRDLCEMVLGHAVHSAVEAAYQRSTLLEKRRTLMQEWSTYCSTVQRRVLSVT